MTCVCLQDALLTAREQLFELSDQAALSAAAGPSLAAALAADQGDASLAAAAAAAVGGDSWCVSEELQAALDNTARLEKEVRRCMP